MRSRDDRDDRIDRLAVVHHDERLAAAHEPQELRRALGREHDDRAVDGAAPQALEQAHLPRRLVLRREEHDPHVPLVQRFGDAGEDVGEVLGVNDGDRHRDEAGVPVGEGPRRPPRRKPLLADYFEHALTRLGRDLGPFVQDPRDGCDRDPGEARDVADRRPPRRLHAGAAHATSSR
jgi:hypothetical protein